MEPLESRDFDGHLTAIREASTDEGRLELIVRRPAVDHRETLEEATLDTSDGLVGDSWAARGSRATPDGSADLEAQLTLISTRVLQAIEPDRERWPLAGDQLYVDFNLSQDSLPSWQPARDRLGHYPGQRDPAYRLRQIQRPLRERCPALDQLPYRSGSSDARAQRPHPGGRHHPHRRRRSARASGRLTGDQVGARLVPDCAVGASRCG